jgi:hypothetical protein
MPLPVQGVTVVDFSTSSAPIPIATLGVLWLIKAGRMTPDLFSVVRTAHRTFPRRRDRRRLLDLVGMLVPIATLTAFSC